MFYFLIGKQRQMQRQRTRGFTLVEILVVLSITALLSALLLSVFVRVRSASRTATCASNLKQIGLALQMYTADNRGFYPLNSVPGHIQCGWAENLYSYVKTTQTFWCPSYPRGEYRPGCPLDDTSQGTKADEIRRWDGSYDMVSLRGNSFNRRFHEMRLHRPSGTVVFLDGVGRPTIRDVRMIANHPNPETEEELLDFSNLEDRHNWGANLCFADGHVKWLSFDAMRDPSLWRPD